MNKKSNRKDRSSADIPRSHESNQNILNIIKHIIPLVIIGALVIIGQPAFAAEKAKPGIEELRSRFVNPPKSAGTTTLMGLNGKLTKENIREKLRYVHEVDGFSGVGFEPKMRKSPPTEPAFLSNEYIDMYGCILETAKDLGMTVVFYDDADFPSGKAGGQMAEKYPDDLLKYLARGTTQVEGAAEARIQMPKGKIMSVVVKDLKTGIRKVVTTEAQWSEDGSSIRWKAPAGRWEVQAFVCATAPRGFLVDFLEPKSVEKFLGLAYDPFYKRFPEHFGTTIKMTFFDDLSVYQAPDDLLWTPSFNEKFQKRFGRSPEALYPALWEDIGSETGSARVSLFGMRNELFAAGYPRTVQEWCDKRGMICSGHPANAYRPNPLQSAGDAILFYKYQKAPLTDYIQYLGNGLDGFKIPSSAAYNFDRDLVVCETYAAFKFDPRDANMLYRAAMQLYARGINYVLPLGSSWEPGIRSSDISSHNPLIGPAMPEFNRWAARCETLLRPGRHVADIAVLYPIDDMEARYSVGLQPGSGSKDPIPGTDYYKLSRLLTGELKRDFTFLHPETVNERCIVDGAEFVLNNVKHWERYRVVILPACRTIRVDNLIKVRDFMRNGGRVIATTCLPEKSAEFGRDAEVKAIAKEMFGPGGKGIFVPKPDEKTLRQTLDGLGIAWDVRIDNATEIPTVKVERGPSPTGGEYLNGNREFAYIHRSLPDCEAYYFANSSEADVSGDITLRGKMKLETWEPGNGTFKTLEGIYAKDHGESITKFKLNLPAIRSIFIIGRKIN